MPVLGGAGVSAGRKTLTRSEAHHALSEHPGWRKEGTTLVRELICRDFDEAMRFLEHVAEMANDYGRRPDMCSSEFNHVRLSISNLHHAGLTLAEFRLAGEGQRGDRRGILGHPDPDPTMTIGTSLFLIAVGAILKYAVTAHVAGINVHMVVGVVGLVIGIFLMFRAAYGDDVAPPPPV